MISILLPTRKRFKYLISSINSLLQTCKDKNNLEILLLFDDDDQETVDQFEDWKNNSEEFNCKHLVVPRLGYSGMHEYNNMLAEISSGDWIFLWNDDSRMSSTNWDELILEGYKDKFVFLSPKNLNNVQYTSTQSMFPIFPKKWYNITGRLSPYQQSDTYLNQVAYRLNIFQYEPRIFHEHGDFDITTENRIQDEVTAEIQYKARVPFNDVMRDVQLIKEYFNNEQ